MIIIGILQTKKKGTDRLNDSPAKKGRAEI